MVSQRRVFTVSCLGYNKINDYQIKKLKKIWYQQVVSFYSQCFQYDSATCQVTLRFTNIMEAPKCVIQKETMKHALPSVL